MGRFYQQGAVCIYKFSHHYTLTDWLPIKVHQSLTEYTYDPEGLHI